MTVKEFHEGSLDLLMAYAYMLYELISDDRQAKKIEPEQKRKLVATVQSLLHDIEDALECELSGSIK